MSPSGTARRDPGRSSPARDGGRRRRWPRAVLLAAAGLAVLALIGVLVQVVLERRDAAAHPPPGDLVTLPDGRLLHLQEAGDQHDGPLVVLEAGAGAFSAAWGWIQPAVAEQHRVVSYDRPGLGWSDPSPHGPHAAAVVADLRAALEARGLEGPYVLVGHSLGGHYVRAFAASHPDDVAGVVLVDPSHEDVYTVLGEDYMAGLGTMVAGLQVAAHLGLTRLYNPMAVEVGLPEPHRSQIEAEQRSVQWMRHAGAEMTALDRVGAQVAGQGLGAVPLRVLIAGSAPDAAGQQQVDAVLPLKQEMAATLSSSGETVLLADAEHVTIVTEPQFAATVAAEVIEVADLAPGGAGHAAVP